MRLLSSLRGLTVKLQKQSKDLVAYDLVADVQLELELLKINCEEEFHLWFEEITKFGESLNIIPISVPRVLVRQVHRSNTPAVIDCPEDYYRQNIMIPFLDHILIEMQERFGGTHQKIVKLLGLIPSIAVSYASVSITEVGKLYELSLIHI